MTRGARRLLRRSTLSIGYWQDRKAANVARSVEWLTIATAVVVVTAVACCLLLAACCLLLLAAACCPALLPFASNLEL
jgi:hypothetical protein